jgi:alkylation response protein AidB-like acyl-CoA dehydrogenase
MAVLSEDQTLVRDAARDWTPTRLSRRAPPTARRRLRRGFDPALWREMAELGWPGVAVSETHGGSGWAGPRWA